MPTETQHLEQRAAALQSDLNERDQRCDDLAFQLNDREGSRRSWFEAAQAAEKQLAYAVDALNEVVKVSAMYERPFEIATLAIGELSASAEPSAKPCKHEWTDDGEFLLICTAYGEQEDHNPDWRDMATAPRDGTMLRLLVEFEEHPTEDADQAPTIGANNFENDEIDEWKFAGWCWTHDHFVEGRGTPVGWLPMLDSKATDWCATMERPKSQCGCPDCGSSLVQYSEGASHE